jgi:hypothetical protein
MEERAVEIEQENKDAQFIWMKEMMVKANECCKRVEELWATLCNLVPTLQKPLLGSE